MKRFPTLVAVVLSCAATLWPARAHAQRERYAPLILHLPASARSVALGGGLSTLRDADANFGNPALLGGTNTIVLSGGRFVSGASTGHIATTMNVGPLGVGFGVAMLDAGGPPSSFPARSDVLLSEGTGAVSSLDASVGASLAWKGMRWGAAIKYVEERQGGGRSGGMAGDVGVSKEFGGGAYTAAAAVQHLGAALEEEASGTQLPSRLALGFGTAPRLVSRYVDVAANAGLVVRRDGEVLPSGGAELIATPIEGIVFAARVGARRPELQAQRPFTTGAGFTFDRLTIDYAWDDMRGSGGAHRISLRVR